MSAYSTTSPLKKNLCLCLHNACFKPSACCHWKLTWLSSSGMGPWGGSSRICKEYKNALGSFYVYKGCPHSTCKEGEQLGALNHIPGWMASILCLKIIQEGDSWHEIEGWSCLSSFEGVHPVPFLEVSHCCIRWQLIAKSCLAPVQCFCNSVFDNAAPAPNYWDKRLCSTHDRTCPKDTTFDRFESRRCYIKIVKKGHLLIRGSKKLQSFARFCIWSVWLLLQEMSWNFFSVNKTSLEV